MMEIEQFDEVTKGFFQVLEDETQAGKLNIPGPGRVNLL